MDFGSVALLHGVDDLVGSRREAAGLEGEERGFRRNRQNHVDDNNVFALKAAQYGKGRTELSDCGGYGVQYK